jgi:hypothetical protein
VNTMMLSKTEKRIECSLPEGRGWILNPLCEFPHLDTIKVMFTDTFRQSTWHLLTTPLPACTPLPPTDHPLANWSPPAALLLHNAIDGDLRCCSAALYLAPAHCLPSVAQFDFHHG